MKLYRTGEDDALVNAAMSRLTSEFLGQIQPSRIGHVVLACRRELQGSPRPALPELVERLARQRLLETAGRS